jgi:hypothetical protein
MTPSPLVSFVRRRPDHNRRSDPSDQASNRASFLDGAPGSRPFFGR